MAKTSAPQLITDLLHRMGQNENGTQERIDALHQLNISQQDMCQEHSLRFLVANATLSVIASSCAVPVTIDDSKTMTLGRVSGDGEIVYVEVDSWFTTGIDTQGEAAAQTEPTLYTIAGATFLFKPAALNAAVPYLAQLRVADMVDDGAHFSVLPEGWENTLLVPAAEIVLRGTANEPRVAELQAIVTAKLTELYGSYRTSKEAAKTDQEQKERKLSRAQLSDEAAG